MVEPASVVGTDTAFYPRVTSVALRRERHIQRSKGSPRLRCPL